jgi:drug/metabolite transporter (DMT)-like permease
MTSSTTGILLALGALVLWSLSPFFFTATGRKIGPFHTNLLRLSLGLPLLLLFCAVDFGLHGTAGIPGAGTTLLLVVSGILGLAAGDHLLYRSFFRVGPERTSLLITAAPAVTTLLAWITLGETLSAAQLGGMGLILAGVFAVVWRHAPAPGSSAWQGAANGIGAALCQGASSVIAREAFLRDATLSPIFATAVRVGAAAAVIAAIAGVRGTLREGFGTLRNRYVSRRILMGTLVGPVLGMIFYVGAMKYQPAGVVTTITFMTPLLVMPLGAWHYGTRIGGRALLGAGAALAGVLLLGWNP